MTLEELRRSSRHQILQLAASYGARNVRVFGSTVRGDNSPASDVDLLVDLDPDRTLMDLGGLLIELQEMLHVPVDVATDAHAPSEGSRPGTARSGPAMRDDRERLRDIPRAIDSILEKAGSGRDAFFSDEMLQVWVLHHLQI
jgi:hypothetical protein